MSLKLYMDVQVDAAITKGLRGRGLDVLTAQQDGTATLPDPQLLDRALQLGRVVFTRDKDFLREAAQRQRSGQAFAGVVYAHQLNASAGRCVTDLELIALLEEPADYLNRVQYLPL